MKCVHGADDRYGCQACAMDRASQAQAAQVSALAQMGPQFCRHGSPMDSDCMACGKESKAESKRSDEFAKMVNSGVEVIRNRIIALEKQLANYRAYQADRVAERDHHGAWDVAINMSETECEIAGLKFALDAIGAVKT